MQLEPKNLARIRVLLIVIFVFASLATFVWFRSRRLGYEYAGLSFREKADTGGSSSNATSSDAAGPPPIPEQSLPQNNLAPTPKIIIPVAGVKPEQLQDTFAEARSEGRVHDAIDIMAPAGTPVLAASDGEIVKLFQSDRGGTTIYQQSPDRKWSFYYAHLRAYADGLAAGKFARQGEVIGYVGDTGNAGAGNYHLHFSIAILADPKRYWEGTNVNPYPLLRR